MFRSDLCDYSDAYFVVVNTVEGENNPKKGNKKLSFENNDPFSSCISKINNTFIDNAEDLGVAMPKYNLLEHSDNYSIPSGSLWNYYRDEINDDANENNAVSKNINNTKRMASKSLEYKTKLLGRTPNNNDILNAEGVVPLKHLSNF